MGILDTLATAASNNSAPATNRALAAVPNQPREERKSSELWLNIGVTIPGAGEDGEDLFISLPVGLPLDDMKPVRVSGTNQQSIHLKQVKNALLDELQKLGAGMQPGQRRGIPQLSIELYRVAKPDQTGNVADNPLMQALARTLTGN